MLSTLDFIKTKYQNIQPYISSIKICKGISLPFAKVIFLHLSVILFTGGGCLGLGPVGCLPREVSRPRPGGCSGPGPGGVCLGVSRPRSMGVQAQARGCPGPGPGPGGCVSQHALRQTPPTPPPSRQLLLQRVRILLESILVLSVYYFFCVFKEVSSCKSLTMCHKKNQNL